ncbi:MAG: hypothetical protein U0031_17550 [Thermomicrobiales bacterium]
MRQSIDGQRPIVEKIAAPLAEICLRCRRVNSAPVHHLPIRPSLVERCELALGVLDVLFLMRPYAFAVLIPSALALAIRTRTSNRDQEGCRKRGEIPRKLRAHLCLGAVPIAKLPANVTVFALGVRFLSVGTIEEKIIRQDFRLVELTKGNTANPDATWRWRRAILRLVRFLYAMPFSICANDATGLDVGFCIFAVHDGAVRRLAFDLGLLGSDVTRVLSRTSSAGLRATVSAISSSSCPLPTFRRVTMLPRRILVVLACSVRLAMKRLRKK